MYLSMLSKETTTKMNTVETEDNDVCENNILIHQDKFENMKIKEYILRQLIRCGFDKPRPIQQIAIPTIIENSERDVFIQARPGSGKTLCYIISGMNSIDRKLRRTQMIIAVEGRELASQIFSILVDIVAAGTEKPSDTNWKYKRGYNENHTFTVALHRGTSNHNNGDRTLEKNVKSYYTNAEKYEDYGNEQIIVGTIQRLTDLFCNPDGVFVGVHYKNIIGRCKPSKSQPNINKTRLNINAEDIKEFIIDECDQILDTTRNSQSYSSFTDIMSYLSRINRNFRITGYTATITTNVELFIDSEQMTKNGQSPLLIDCNDYEDDNEDEDEKEHKQAVNIEKVSHYYFAIAEERDIYDAIDYIIRDRETNANSTMIFAEGNVKCNSIYSVLKSEGYSVGMLYGKMSQSERDREFSHFINRKYRVLVCTDIMTRGIDNDSIDIVINIGFTTPTEYKHRSGRAGRGINGGKSITIFTSQNNNALPTEISRYEQEHLIRISNYFQN